jgi:DNA repair exonuclease SbcCD ATPase subunit
MELGKFFQFYFIYQNLNDFLSPFFVYLADLMSCIHELLCSLTTYCPNEIKLKCNNLNSLRNEKDLTKIVTELHDLQLLVNKWYIEKDPLKNIVSNYNMEHLKNIHEHIQANMDKMSDTGESNIQQLKIQLKDLFGNFQDIFYAQSEHIASLDRRLCQLEKEKKNLKKFKIIGDLLTPLSKVHSESKTTNLFHYLMLF